MIRFSALVAFLATFLFSALSAQAQRADFSSVIPAPLHIQEQGGGAFVLDEGVQILPLGSKGALQREARFLQQYIEQRTGLQLALAKKQKKGVRYIVLALGAETQQAEGYVLTSGTDELRITGRDAAGVFYGIQVLRKSLPAKSSMKSAKIEVPAAQVSDAPRFSYRGAHLDVSRHFITPDSVRRFIDLIALHQINRFHWHLTDDQGWRIEIKKYPRLTEVGAYRPETVIGHNSGKYDGTPHQGFYTQQEIRDIIAYAAERHITIVPEIDLPGHMQAALAAYPKLGCTGGPYEVWKIWGISDDVLCAGNDETLRFIDDVLTEVCALFPSQYIHVGGDECPKTRWKTCPKCQARIDAENLRTGEGNHTPEERLQSYVIRHAERTLSKLGRYMIGWDETLEGGLADGATVMSWRGEAGGIEAARQGHDVIMTPNTYLYFDYYQSADVENEPEAIGGFLPLERVYSYEPMPRRLNAEQQKHIIGVQANLWTEYIPTFRQVEYMELPRMAALCEIQWSAAEKKNYADFCRRLTPLTKIYDEMGYSYGRHAFDVNGNFAVNTEENAIQMTLSCIDPSADLRYTLDGTTPTSHSPRYEAPVLIRESAQVCARRIDGTAAAGAKFQHGKKLSGGNVVVQRACDQKEYGAGVHENITFHRATACPIRLLSESHDSYKFGGASTLVDGMVGRNTNYKTGHWLGFAGNDLEAVITLPEGAAAPESVTIHTCVEKGDWIFDARRVAVYASSDGKAFTLVAEEKFPSMQATDRNGIYTHTLSLAAPDCLTGKIADETADFCKSPRFLKVVVESEKRIPSWHGAAGSTGFLFVDEIIVQ